MANEEDTVVSVHKPVMELGGTKAPGADCTCWVSASALLVRL